MNNPYIAYALWFFVGWLGAHRLYLGKFISGFFMMGLFFVGSAFAWIFIGWIFLIIWGIWWLMDVFLIGVCIEQNLKKDSFKKDLELKDKEEELRKLYELYEQNKITKAELEAKKEILFR
ncbi:NINE protein [Campylobacter pinnipediorum]|uniref:NINE protein n=1 Tax=Campylobacter pinnipediorum TaxID=1965231 RepID=UPI00084DA341|nr:NINE protein [Campylobacter pinnipediorum]